MEELIHKWFYDNFYNQSFSTEQFNHALQAKEDLLARLKTQQFEEDKPVLTTHQSEEE